MSRLRLAGALAIALAIAWLPGQTSAGALRTWICAGVVPCCVLWRGRLDGGVWWALLAGLAFLHGASAAGVGLWQLGWWAALLLGRHAPARHGALATAGALAALPGLVDPRGLFGNPDFLAAFVAICVPSMVVQARADRRWTLALCVAAGALIQANSLGAWAALAITGLVALAIHRRALAAIALVGLSGVALVAQDTLGDHLRGRLHLVETAAYIAKDVKLNGVGPGGFHGAFLEEQARHHTPVELWTNAHHAHNEPAHVAVEQGLPGVVLLCFPLLLAMRRRPNAYAAATLIGAILGLVTLPLYMAGVSFLVAHALGASLGPPPERRAWPTAGRVLGVLLLAVATTQLIGDRVLARANAERDAQLAETASIWLLRPAPALRLAAALRPPDAAALALVQRAERLDRSVEGSLLEARIHHLTGDHPAAIRACLRTVRLNPRLFAGWFNLARAYEDSGDRASARQAARRARALRPSDPRLRHLPE